LNLIWEEVTESFLRNYFAETFHEGTNLILSSDVQHVVAVLRNVDQSVFVCDCYFCTIRYQGKLLIVAKAILRHSHGQSEVFNILALVIFDLHQVVVQLGVKSLQIVNLV